MKLKIKHLNTVNYGLLALVLTAASVFADYTFGEKSPLVKEPMN